MGMAIGQLEHRNCFFGLVVGLLDLKWDQFRLGLSELQIERYSDMYWMLDMNWFQDNLVLAKFVQEILVICTAVCKKIIYTGIMMGYCSLLGCHQKLALSMENNIGI